MRITIVTDAWKPQVNGVVRTLGRTSDELRSRGHAVDIVSPLDFKSLPCPTYPEIRLSLNVWHIDRRLADLAPDAVHIATEGPLGWAARRWCLRRGYAFTTAYHTRFPEYVGLRFAVPLGASYALLRRFHDAAARVMVATPSIERDLRERGFKNLARWSRGVDTDIFRPGERDWLDLPRPIFLHVGRVAVEKNIKAFLDLDLPGSKLVIGDGPQLEELRREYPGVGFTGLLDDAELARHYAAADVFVFPSKTDTFGLVLLEALASGVPVAAYPAPGPIDVLGDAPVGAIDEDLRSAALRALDAKSGECRAHALRYSWAAATDQFLSTLAPIGSA